MVLVKKLVRPSFLALSLVFGLPLTAYAGPSFDLKDVTYSVEPIIGYTLEQKSAPSPHAKMVLTYGARVIAGYKILAAEGEYTRGNSDEEFLDQDLRVQELTEKYKLGLRTSYEVATYLKLSLRGGGEMEKHKTSTTSAGVLSESDSPAKVAPYVGGGIEGALGQKVSLTAEGTATLRDLNDLSQTEYQGTFGLKLSLGTK